MPGGYIIFHASAVYAAMETLRFCFVCPGFCLVPVIDLFLACNESQSDEVNGVDSIPVWSGGMDFEEIGQKQNRSFRNVVLEKNA